jgi:hypothetical protein
MTDIGDLYPKKKVVDIDFKGPWAKYWNEDDGGQWDISPHKVWYGAITPVDITSPIKLYTKNSFKVEGDGPDTLKGGQWEISDEQSLDKDLQEAVDWLPLLLGYPTRPGYAIEVEYAEAVAKDALLNHRPYAHTLEELRKICRHLKQFTIKSTRIEATMTELRNNPNGDNITFIVDNQELFRLTKDGLVVEGKTIQDPNNLYGALSEWVRMATENGTMPPVKTAEQKESEAHMADVLQKHIKAG